MADKKIPDLNAAQTIDLTDLLLLEHGNSTEGYDSQKLVMSFFATWLASQVEYPLLLTETTAKTLIGAINEIAAGGESEIDDTTTDSASTWSSSRIASFLPTDTAQGTVANFPDGADNIPVDSLLVNIVATQEGTGDPSPSNERPIIGVSNVNIGNTSDLTEWFKGIYEGVYNFVDLGSLEWTYISNGVFRSADLTTRKSGADVTPKCSSYVFWGTASSQSTIVSGLSNMQFAFRSDGVGVLVKNDSYSDAELFKNAVTGVYLIYELATPMTPTITEAQFRTLCTAFGINGTILPISLGQTVYGGELDVTNGVLRVTWIRQDIGGWTWTQNQTDPNTFNSPFIAIGSPIQPANTSDAICEVCPLYTSSTVTQYDYGFAIAIGLNYFYFKNKDYDSPADFKTAMSGKYFVYKLATPVEITLTPEEIATFKGENNIWADCGDVAVTYRADIGLYIDKKIAEGNGNRGLSIMKSAPEEVKEETKQEEQEEQNDDAQR